MALEFADGSDVLPPGRHLATVEEIEEALVAAFPNSETRRALFEKWQAVRDGIERVVPVVTEWLDGSYVTKKENPADIDMVTHLSGEAVDGLDAADQALLLGLVSNKISQTLHGCDSYWCPAFPEDHPQHPVYQAACEYWDRWLGHDRDGNAKGYVEVK